MLENRNAGYYGGRVKILLVVVLTIAALALVAGCRKQQSTLLPAVPPAPVDTEARAVAPDDGPIDTSDDAVFREAQLEAEMQRRVVESLLPVYFEFNSYRLSQESIERLVKAASFLSEFSSLRVLVEGHCDERGSSEYNLGLGENRSRVVREYLVNYGLAANRIEVTSYGKERPARAGCADDGCHATNRRAEFRVIQR